MVTVWQSQGPPTQSLFPLLVTPRGPGIIQAVYVPPYLDLPVSCLTFILKTLDQAPCPFKSPRLGLACKMQSIRWVLSRCDVDTALQIMRSGVPSQREIPTHNRMVASMDALSPQVRGHRPGMERDTSQVTPLFGSPGRFLGLLVLSDFLTSQSMGKI